MTLTIKIDPDINRRLDELAARTGESKADLLRNALANGIEDVEDYFSAAAILRRVESGEEKTYPLEDVLRELDLEN
jgi:RHH-type rel operon transcriptional repressor/antitoxin RelB